METAEPVSLAVLPVRVQTVSAENLLRGDLLLAAEPLAPLPCCGHLSNPCCCPAAWSWCIRGAGTGRDPCWCGAPAAPYHVPPKPVPRPHPILVSQAGPRHGMPSSCPGEVTRGSEELLHCCASGRLLPSSWHQVTGRQPVIWGRP